jgi:predicted dehydrogenase
MTIFKAGLVGCGAIGSFYDEQRTDGVVYTHAGMYSRTTGLTLCAMADQDPDRLKEAGRHWGPVNLYSCLEDMLRQETLDVVSIATPDHTHADLIETTLKHGRPKIIFCEKPLAVDSEKAKMILEKCEAAEVILGIDYIRCWDKTYLRLKEYILNNSLGEIETVTGYYVRGLRHNACHLINLMRYLFGRIAAVRALGDGFSESVNFQLFIENDLTINIMALDLKGYHYSIFEFDIFGSFGRFRISDGGLKIEYFCPSSDRIFTNFKTLKPADSPIGEVSYNEAMLEVGLDLLSVLNGGKPSLKGRPEEAIKDLETIEAIFRSAREGGRIVTLNES